VPDLYLCPCVYQHPGDSGQPFLGKDFIDFILLISEGSLVYTMRRINIITRKPLVEDNESSVVALFCDFISTV